MEIPEQPVYRVHMRDCKRQVLDEQAKLHDAASEVLAWFVALGMFCWGAWRLMVWWLA